MVRRFCDNCGVELNNRNEVTVLLSGAGGVQFRVTDLGFNDQNSNGDRSDVCKYCVLDAIRSQHDDRPQAV